MPYADSLEALSDIFFAFEYLLRCTFVGQFRNKQWVPGPIFSLVAVMQNTCTVRIIINKAGERVTTYNNYAFLAILAH